MKGETFYLASLFLVLCVANIELPVDPVALNAILCQEEEAFCMEPEPEPQPVNTKFADQCQHASVLETLSDVIVIPDIHGDLNNLLYALHNLSIIDENYHWIGGEKVVVQTGDIFDRGPDTSQILQFMQSLKKDAALQGGCVVTLMGNHELMNLQHDFRYASGEETKGFGGYYARKQEMSYNSEVGKELRNQRIGILIRQYKLDDYTKERLLIKTILLVHAGLRYRVSEVFQNSVEQMNKFAIEFLKQKNGWEITEAMRKDQKAAALFGNDGPLWTRYLIDQEQRTCPEVERTLEAIGADHMIVGHSVQESQFPTFRCGQKVVLTDVGMSRFYGGGRHFILVEKGTGILRTVDELPV